MLIHVYFTLKLVVKIKGCSRSLALCAVVRTDGAFPLARSERSGASVLNSFLWKLSLNACAVHYGIESGAEKALRAAESVKKFGHSSTLCKYREKNARRQSIAVKRRR